MLDKTALNLIQENLQLNLKIAELEQEIAQLKTQKNSTASTLPPPDPKTGEAMFKQLIQSNVIGLLFCDIYGKINEANDAFLDIIGYSREDLVAGIIRWNEITPAEWLPLEAQYIAEAQAVGVARPYEKEYVHKDGRRVPVLIGYILLGEKREESVAFILDLTRQKELERQQNSQGEMLKLAQKTGKIGLSEWFIQENRLVWSPGMEALYGLAPGSFGGTYEDWVSRVHPDDLKILQEKTPDELDGRNPSVAQFRVIWPDNTVHWLYAENQIYPDQNNKPLRAIGVSIDITAQKQNEEALRLREERFRLAQQVSPDGFVLMPAIRDEHGQLVDFTWDYINPTTAKLLNSSLEELRGKSALTYYPTLKPTGVFDRYVEVAESGIPQETEVNYQGDNINGWYRLAIVKAGDGIALSYIDITERKRAEENLAFLVEISDALASSIDYNTTLATVSRLTVPKLADSCIVDLLDEHGNLERVAVGHVDPTRANLLLEMSRRFPSYGIKSSLHTTVVQQRRTIIIPQVQQELVEAYVQSEEHRQMVEAIGPHRSLVVVPIMARDRLLGAFSFEMGLSNRSFSKADLPMLEEVTHRVAVAIDNARLYQEAQHALATQQELDNLKDLFLSVTTHELRNPLTSISGYAQMLQRQVLKQVANTSDEQPDWNKFSRPVQAIIDQGNRLNEMINQLLDFSRIQNGKLEIQPVSGLNLLQLAERVVEQQQLTTSDHSLLLKAPSGPVLATYDAARLEQVLDNLISNAFKYSLPGTTVIVGVESFSASGEAVLWVKDDGYGIEPEQQAHIFDRFYRIRNDETTRIEGLGLGLYITREIIKAHNGRIWLVSEAEKGSTFYIALPASQNEI